MPSTPKPATPRERTTTLTGLIGRITALALIAAAAVYLIPLLITFKMWLWLAIVVVSVLAAFLLYSTKRFIPGKYLFPGTFFLVIFLIVPIILTIQTSFTNFGDGFRGTKEEAISTITNNSIQQTKDSPLYNLSVGTKESAAEGPFTLFLVDPATGKALRGADGETVTEAGSDVTVEDGFVTKADGYTILSAQQVNDAYKKIEALNVMASGDTVIKAQGVRAAFEGTRSMVYDKASDTITATVPDPNTGAPTSVVYSVQKVGKSDFFVADDGTKLAQSWKQNVGLENYKRLFTDSSIGKQFFKAFLWTVVFAFGSVLLSFLVGFFLALTLNDDRVRGKKLYRSFLLLPYAVPGFISLLVWSNFYNKDFGLINQTLHLSIPWFSDPTMAKIAILLTNTWMGFPYMFIVCTGALQSIAGDVKEAAKMDGANGWQTTTRVTAPLLLVAVAPLLVSSFAFNFNNFNAIQLLTGGGPFGADEYTRGGTDILISMIYRIAFGGSGADYGFASAVSVILFIITGLLAAIQFRATKALEDIN